MKSIFAQGLIAGILSALSSAMYFYIYQNTLMVDFSKMVNIGSIIGASVVGCMLISLGYALLTKLEKTNLLGWLNIFICILSFASIIGPISMSLPLDIEYPELFPGLVVPMHFFPALAYFTIHPFFITNKN